MSDFKDCYRVVGEAFDPKLDLIKGTQAVLPTKLTKEELLLTLAMQHVAPSGAGGRFRWLDYRNEKHVKHLSNDAHSPVQFFAGSQMEGLSLDKAFGYSWSDCDVMHIFPTKFDVTVAGRGGLNLNNIGQPAAFVNVKAGPSVDKDVIKYLEHIDDEIEDEFYLIPQRITGRMYEIIGHKNCDPHGPAISKSIWFVDYDHVATLACKAPFPEMKNFPDRIKNVIWKTLLPLDRMCNTKGLLVAASHKGCSAIQQKYQFRKSFSVQEWMLMRAVPEWVRQAGVVFKYMIKKELKMGNCDYLCSYHMKTTLMWLLERIDVEIWELESSAKLLVMLIDELMRFLAEGFLPNYWVPEANLLDTVDEQARNRMVQTVQNARQNLLWSVINSVDSPLSVDPGVYQRMTTGFEKGKYFKENFFRLFQGRLARRLGEIIVASNDALYIRQVSAILASRALFWRQLWDMKLTTEGYYKYIMATVCNQQHCIAAYIDIFLDTVRWMPTCLRLAAELHHENNATEAEVACYLGAAVLCLRCLNVNETAASGEDFALVWWYLDCALTSISLKKVVRILELMPDDCVRDEKCRCRCYPALRRCWKNLVVLLQRDNMQYYGFRDRLSTFDSDSPKSSEFARWGFYCHSPETLKCYSCAATSPAATKIKTVKSIHKDYCRHVQQMKDAERFTEGSDIEYPEFSSSLSRRESTLLYPECQREVLEDLMAEGFFFNERKPSFPGSTYVVDVHCFCCGFSVTDPHIDCDSKKRFRRKYHFCNFYRVGDKKMARFGEVWYINYNVI